MRLPDWLDISTDGFAQRQLDRPPAHLIKELVQNALDATEDQVAGAIAIILAGEEAKDPGQRKPRRYAVLTVIDNGPGIEDPKDLRTVFCSGKEDRFTLRGRLGQGFKEILCLAREATVTSRGRVIRFHRVNGERVTDIDDQAGGPAQGTLVRMLLPWEAEIVPEVEVYLKTFIAPAGRVLQVNGQVIEPRQAAQHITASLRTELYDNGRWLRRKMTGVIDLVPIQSDEEPMIYEMGIPVCPLDWTPRVHANVLMRVPMNPRRDAVASGYHKELYAAVLPHLLPTLNQDDLRTEWVSEAVTHVGAATQQEIVRSAFGKDAVRSVPTMGERHDWDSDARELGYTPIDTRLLPQGLRSAANEFLPTSRDVELERRESIVAAATGTVTLTPELERVVQVYRWFGRELTGAPVIVSVVPTLVINGEEAAAAWQTGGRLLLNLSYRGVWGFPFSEAALGLLTHETAHDRAAHHGDDFRRAVERIAGKLARLCLFRADEIKGQFADVMKAA